MAGPQPHGALLACPGCKDQRLRSTRGSVGNVIPQRIVTRGLTKAELHRRIIDALAAAVHDHGDLAHVPLALRVQGLIPLAVFAFTLTSPPGGRHPLEQKIQLIAPGQQRGERGNLTAPEGTFRVLMGVDPRRDLFVLWDAYKHRDFAWSKNVQVRSDPLVDAESLGIGRMERELSTGKEMIIACQGSHLREALRERIAH